MNESGQSLKLVQGRYLLDAGTTAPQMTKLAAPVEAADMGVKYVIKITHHV